MILVDTSVWIEVFRRRQFDIEGVLDFEEIVTCLPVIQEVLQGFDDQHAYHIACESMLSFPCVESPMGEDVFLRAVELYREARRVGVTVRSSVDCLIAACALGHSLVVCHRDRDYESLAKVSRLRTLKV